MGTREMGIDAAFAWPGAQIRSMDVESLIKHIYHDEIANTSNAKELLLKKSQQFEQEFAEPYWSGAMMLVDDIIDPRQTRQIILETLERLSRKSQPVRPWRKHGLIPM
jgi:propionyl-CoA carboxylase beta chain